jgi:viologen exporter family transport system permease protein
VQALPLQYMAYFPAAVFLQKISGAAMWQGLAVQTAWIVFFIVACRVAFHRGVRRYSAYGG